MSEVRKSIKGHPRTWVAVAVGEVTIREGQETRSIVMVHAALKGAAAAGVQGIFRMDEWRKLKVVES